MKIEKGQIIAEQPVLKVRDFFKRYEQYSVEDAASFFAISKKAASEMCLDLVQLGYSERIHPEQMAHAYKKKIWYDLLPLGRSLRLARAIPSITRPKADQILKDFMARVEAVNNNERYVYKVNKVLLFGSYIRPEIIELNDIDIAVEIISKFNDPESRRRKNDEYTRAAIDSGRRFDDWLDQMFCPERDVRTFLRTNLAISVYTQLTMRF